jgi:hypothetical protein
VQPPQRHSLLGRVAPARARARQALAIECLSTPQPLACAQVGVVNAAAPEACNPLGLGRRGPTPTGAPASDDLPSVLNDISAFAL